MENQKLDHPNSSFSFVLLHNFLPILITPPPDYGFVWWSSQEPAHSQYPIPISPVTLLSFPHFLSLCIFPKVDQCLKTQQFIHVVISFFVNTDWQGEEDHIFIGLDCCIGLLVRPAFPAIFSLVLCPIWQVQGLFVYSFVCVCYTIFMSLKNVCTNWQLRILGGLWFLIWTLTLFVVLCVVLVYHAITCLAQTDIDIDSDISIHRISRL